MGFDDRARRELEHLVGQAMRRGAMSTPQQRQGPMGTVRRKMLMQEARLLAARWSLEPHLDAFVYRAGHEALTGLDIEQLEQLVALLQKMGSAIECACDPPLPPAR